MTIWPSAAKASRLAAVTAPPTDSANDVGARAAGRRAKLLDPVRLRIIHADVRAERLGEREFFGGAGGGDHGACAGPLRELSQNGSDPASRGGDHHRLAFGRRLAREVKCCEALDHQRGGLFEGQLVGKRRRKARIDHDIFGISAEGDARREKRRSDALSDGEILNAGAQSRDDAGCLRAKDGGKRRRHCVTVHAHERLGEIHADRARLNENLAGTRLWRRKLDNLKNFRTAEAANLSDFHFMPRRLDCCCRVCRTMMATRSTDQFVPY